jgi:phosphoglycolate phosphatase-like HAD superfamily hydrolase
MTIKVLLWDFGDTLVDERWMLRAPADVPSWPDAWVDVMSTHAEQWNVGDVGMDEIFAQLAKRTGMAFSDVASHARYCCQHISFHESSWRLARERRFPQAIVTVNPDLFAEFVVPAYDLSSTFDIIVMSYAERTADKSALCGVALERLGFRGDPTEAMLIDNRADLVQGWIDAGGSGYWFQSEELFRRDLAQLLE